MCLGNAAHHAVDLFSVNRAVPYLQLKKGDKNFGKACRVEVERYEQESAKDYRLNFRLYDACKADVGQICKDACKLQDGEICGGKVRLSFCTCTCV